MRNQDALDKMWDDGIERPAGTFFWSKPLKKRPVWGWDNEKETCLDWREFIGCETDSIVLVTVGSGFNGNVLESISRAKMNLAIITIRTTKHKYYESFNEVLREAVGENLLERHPMSYIPNMPYNSDDESDDETDDDDRNRNRNDADNDYEDVPGYADEVDRDVSMKDMDSEEENSEVDIEDIDMNMFKSLCYSDSLPQQMQLTSPGGMMQPSTSSNVNTPMGPASQEDREYLEKVKSLQKYIEPLKNMIAEMGNDNYRDRLTKMKKLFDIISNPRRGMPISILQKCEDVLKRMSLDN